MKTITFIDHNQVEINGGGNLFICDKLFIHRERYRKYTTRLVHM